MTVPRITFAGDTHGRLDHPADASPDDLIIHVGDFAPVDRPVSELLPAGVLEHFYFIFGNHDYDRPECHHGLLDDPALAKRTLHGRVLQFGDLRVAGNGRVFKGRMCSLNDALTEPDFPRPAGYIKSLPRKALVRTRTTRGHAWGHLV